MSTRHFLSLDDIPADQLNQLLARGIELKQQQQSGLSYTPLRDKTLAMIFNKASTRTRVSFEVGMRQLGGGAINLTPGDTQMGRGEPVEDTARVISSMADCIMIRTDDHAQLETFAEYSRVPVINGLTDDVHPCQLLADLMTLLEAGKSLSTIDVAWVGDGNNVCHSWMNAARIFGFTLRIATPKGFEPNTQFLDKNAGFFTLGNEAVTAVEGADVVVTDTWASMGQESEKGERQAAFSGFCVDQELITHAKSDAVFMHCLPAYRGQEVTADVLEGEQSLVFEEAENRLHAQKALLEHLLV
jgi:ornithine carbamoyltransferase